MASSLGKKALELVVASPPAGVTTVPILAICRWAAFHYEAAANVAEVVLNGYSSGNEQWVPATLNVSVHGLPGCFPVPQGKVEPARLLPNSVASA